VVGCGKNWQQFKSLQACLDSWLVSILGFKCSAAPNFIKTFYGHNLQMFVKSSSLCLGRPFQLNQMFVSKAGELTQ
jgi:hypothetical protein